MKRVMMTIALATAALLVLSACGGSPTEAEPSGGVATVLDDGAVPGASSPDGEEGASSGEAEFYMASAVASDKQYNYIYSYMAEKVEKRSNGRITMEVFYNDELASINREQLEMCRNNLIQWQTVPAFAYFTQSPNLSGYLIFDLPFIFDDWDQFDMFCDSDFAREKLYPLSEKELGVTTFSGINLGFVQLATNIPGLYATGDCTGACGKSQKPYMKGRKRGSRL